MNIPEILAAMSQLPEELQDKVLEQIHAEFGAQVAPTPAPPTEDEIAASKEREKEAEKARIAAQEEEERKRLAFEATAREILDSIRGFDTVHQTAVLKSIAQSFGVHKAFVDDGQLEVKTFPTGDGVSGTGQTTLRVTIPSDVGQDKPPVTPVTIDDDDKFKNTAPLNPPAED